MSRKRKNIEDELVPTVKLTSDGDLLLQELLERQLSKETTLQHELLRRKEYISSTEYADTSHFAYGENSLNEFQNSFKYVEISDKLRAAGMSNEDIEFYRNSKEYGLSYLEVKHKNLGQLYIKQKLKYIESVLNQNELRNINHLATSTNRQKTEVMLSVKPNSIETTLLKFALGNEQKNDKFPSAMSNIKQIEKDTMNSLKHSLKINASKMQKRLRTMKNHIDSAKLLDQFNTHNQKIVKKDAALFVEKSKWDVKVVELEHNLGKKLSSKVYACESAISKNFYTIKDGVIVNLNADITSAPSVGEYKKLSSKEIRQISKFKHYNPGTPSKILYLKNLTKLAHNDLECILKSFNITFKSVRVLNGKMKGQAFIEMESIETAKQGLNCLNGLVFHKKPIIVEFGKASD